VVLAGKAGGPPRPPSAAARALAVLLEYSDRSMDAGDIAARLGCSVPAARTTLNRLVKSGHAMRTAPGWFRARSG
jgi:predicted ArsR family transcriptional regulator